MHRERALLLVDVDNNKLVLNIDRFNQRARVQILEKILPFIQTVPMSDETEKQEFDKIIAAWQNPHL